MLPVYRINKKHFYPRPPRGGRHAHVGVCHLISGFLSTPSARRVTQKLHIGRFLSTPSARRATGRLCLTVPIPMISIHALREEGDWPPVSTSSMYSNFYPRPPRGGRPNTRHRSLCTNTFLSTPSARRATLVLCTPDSSIGIFLSTPSARRATAETLEVSPTMIDFYPRPPRGGRQLFLCGHSSELYFYPRPPRGGRHQQPRGKKRAAYFYPRPPRGGRPMWPWRRISMTRFLSTPSARRATQRPGGLC